MKLSERVLRPRGVKGILLQTDVIVNTQAVQLHSAAQKAMTHWERHLAHGLSSKSTSCDTLGFIS